MGHRIRASGFASACRGGSTLHRAGRGRVCLPSLPPLPGSPAVTLVPVGQGLQSAAGPAAPHSRPGTVSEPVCGLRAPGRPCRATQVVSHRDGGTAPCPGPTSAEGPQVLLHSLAQPERASRRLARGQACYFLSLLKCYCGKLDVTQNSAFHRVRAGARRCVSCVAATRRHRQLILPFPGPNRTRNL